MHTVTPDIHFSGYYPSPILEYVLPQKKCYGELPIPPFDRECVQERFVAVKPWYPLSDQPESMLIAFELNDEHSLYNIRAILYAFHPVSGLNLEKRLVEGYAVTKQSIYSLAWLGITPFARELTRFTPLKNTTWNSALTQEHLMFSLLSHLVFIEDAGWLPGTLDEDQGAGISGAQMSSRV